MALREVLQFPDPRLKRVSEPIREMDEALRELARDLCQVMYDEPGIGLAAPQVGEAVRMIVVDTEWTKEDEDEEAVPAERNPLVVVNPEIVHREGVIVWNEGCLSVPDFAADVERAERVTLHGTNLDGKDVHEQAEGLRAVCFQHEIDHLDGILFIDRISRLKRSLYVKKRKKQLREEEEEGQDRARGHGL
ncbi:MAG: peptide deformylase [Proteobacteria bacterium]|nr:peptide deformylase [Pseudomonadota bacterium]